MMYDILEFPGVSDSGRKLAEQSEGCQRSLEEKRTFRCLFRGDETIRPNSRAPYDLHGRGNDVNTGFTPRRGHYQANSPQEKSA